MPRQQSMFQVTTSHSRNFSFLKITCCLFLIFLLCGQVSGRTATDAPPAAISDTRFAAENDAEFFLIINLSTVVNNVTCFNGTDGSIDLTVTGGSAPYTYDWSNDGPETPDNDPQDLSGLAAGVYVVTVTDNSGVTATTSATVTQPSAIVLSTVVTPISCNGGSDGAINLTVSGGVPGYSESWSTGSGSEDVSGLPFGTYYVTVTDGNGCTATTSATVTQPSAFNLTKIITNVSCGGGADGAIDLTVTGGTSPYTYDWSNLPGSNNPQDLNGLAAGTYCVTVTDANSCTATTCATITQPTALSLTKTITNVSCGGAADGAIDLTVTGGISPYSYNWGPGQPTTQDRTGLTAGTYCVTVTDVNGCTATTCATITQPSALFLTKTITNVSCGGGSDGAIDLTVTGGASPFSYNWGPGQPTTQDRTGLTAGTYCVTVTDVNGCTATTCATITQPSAILLTKSITKVSCNGGSDGAIDLTVTGGASPYSYNWGPGQPTTQDRTGLTAGTYCVTVTDANGCSATTCSTISQPPVLVLSQSITNVSCGGGSDGAIDLTVTGGTSPYTYDWSNLPGSNNPQDINGLVAGTYCVTVTDANNCTATTCATITQPTALSLTQTTTNVSCGGGADGAIDLTVTGGTSPYTYNWGPGQPTTQDRTGLTAGTYCVTVTDGNNCTSTTCATITQPTALSLTKTITNVSCGGGSDGAIDLTVTGGVSPYSYNWGPGQPTTQDRTGLVAGTYCVTVTDVNGCTATTCATITQPAALSLTKSITKVSCNGGSDGAIDLTVTGGASPYSYNWGPGQPTTQDRTGLTAGTYCVTVTDVNGCTATTCSTVSQPPVLALTQTITNVSCGGGADGAIDLTVTGGTSPYSYNWGPGQPTTQDRTGLTAGTYCVTVTDDNGCTATTCATITQPTALSLTKIITNVSCGGGADGAIDLTVTGGTSPYSYNWGPGQPTTQDRTGLTAGTYCVTVTDGNNCTSTTCATITQPTALSLSKTTINVSCNGGTNGAIDLTVTGGTSPYSYNWGPGQPTTQDRTGLSAGTYCVTVTDANNCTSTTCTTITQPTALSLSKTTANVSCVNGSDGAIDLTVSGGTPGYTYDWDNDGLETPDNDPQDLSGLSAGTYCVIVTDANACSATTCATITSPGAPTISCPGNQTRGADLGVCSYTAISGEFDPVASGSNCPGTSISYTLTGATSGNGLTTLAGKAFQKGLTTVTWTVTDAVSQSASCSFTVSVFDGQLPTITCPGNQSRNAGPGLCNYTTTGAEFDPLAFGDNCPGASLVWGNGIVSGTTTLAGQIFQVGTTAMYWTVTDGSSQNASCSFFITIVDNQAPAIICPGSQIHNTNFGCAYSAQPAEFNPVSVTDNCSTTATYVLTGATTGSGTYIQVPVFIQKGQTTVTWTVTDGSNNTATCSFVMTVNDVQPPSLNCYTVPVTIPTDPGFCTYTVFQTQLDAVNIGDNCPGVGVAYVLTGVTTGTGVTTLAGKVFQKGLTTVTWTATDASNNTASCSFNVTIFDAQPPSITCPGAQTRNTNSGVCTYTAAGAEFNPSAFNDNCPGASIAYVLSGATTGSGTTTLAGKVFNKGITMVNWTVTDGANQTAVCAFNVTVNDNQSPTLTCPGALSRNANTGACTYTAVGAELDPLSFGDNCSGTTLTYVLSGATTGNGATTLAGKVFQKGQTTVVWTAKDAANNTATCSFVLTVNDTQAPGLSCPGNQTRSVNLNSCTYTVVGSEFNLLFATDNCPGITIAYALTGVTTGNGSTLAGKVFNKGVTTVTWTATDASNNTATCSFTVTIKDTQAPLLICPLNLVRNTNTGLCTYTALNTEFDPIPFTDNCPGVSIAYVLTGVTTGSGATTLGGKVFNKGQTTIKWTATDASNNTASCSYTVDVKDLQGPTITCPGNPTRGTNPGLCSYATIATEFDPTTYGDNCPGVVGISYTMTGATTGTGVNTLAGKVIQKGFTTVTWKATDAANNTATCVVGINVKDTEFPVFTNCQPSALYNVPMTAGCTLTIPDLTVLTNATDNCPGLTKTQLPLAGTVLSVVHNQSIPVVVTAKDASGNTITCNRIVKAKDVTPPTIITCPPNRTVSLSPDCKITVPDMRTQVVATDCSLPLTVTQNPAQGTLLPCDAGDVFNVTMTVKDAAGNSKTCNVVLTAEFRYFAYICNSGTNKVAVLNTTSNSTIAQVSTLHWPASVSVSLDGAKVYIGNTLTQDLTVINTATNTPTNFTLGYQPFAVCISPNGNRLYVGTQQKLLVVDPITHLILASVPFASNADVASICTSPDGSKVYCTTDNNGAVNVIDANSNTLITTITAPGMDASQICINPSGSRIYVSGFLSNKITVINTQSNTVVATMNAGPGHVLSGICSSTTGAYVYVVNRPNNVSSSVLVVDANTNTIVNTITGLGQLAQGIDITPDGKWLYVCNENSNTVSIINTSTNTVTSTLTGFSYPTSIGRFIGGPLCLFGNNQPPVSGPDEATPAGEEPLAAERTLLSPELRAMPNPFTDELTVAFDLEAPARAQVVLADLTGRFVIFEKDNALDAGPQSLVWNTEDLPGGAYLVGLKVEGKAWTYRKVMLVR